MSTTEPALHFKRRKTNHTRRLPTASAPDAPDAADAPDALKDILRNRKRPRPRDGGHRREAPQSQAQALIPADTSKQASYGSRFVVQTGEVVQKDDEHMTEYIEARLAEKNHRLYGWPVPKHLEPAVSAIAPELEHTADSAPVERRWIAGGITTEQNNGVSADQSHRLAAGMGKLHEVDLGPGATSRNMQRTAQEESVSKVRLGRDGKPRRPPKRRNSADLRRDQMVEAVLRESKLDYFEEDKPLSTPAPGEADNDDAMVEKFRLEFLESVEARQQRKPAPAAAKGVKEAPKGPKLGGSRSARAAMRLQEEQAAKNKR